MGRAPATIVWLRRDLRLTDHPAMRELWTTGWMHGRTRMIAASFLVENADGSYVRRFLPVLKGLPDAVVREPWEVSALDLLAALAQMAGRRPRP